MAMAMAMMAVRMERRGRHEVGLFNTCSFPLSAVEC